MKMIKINNLLWVLLAIVSMTACHKDVDEGEVRDTVPFSPTVVQETSGDVLGYIYDDAGHPLSDVTVQVYGNSTTTDERGIYRFDNVRLDGNGTYITAQKDGYILGSDMLYPLQGEVYSYIQMLPLKEHGTISSASGGQVDVEGGGSVSFLPNTIAKADGTGYAGQVVVTAYRLAADDDNIGDLMPGGLYAQASNGNNVVLGTYGMVAIELRGAGGEELNLLDGATAEVVIPIAQEQQSSAPAEIELWSFDELAGIWIEEGVATRVGDEYVAQVSHFSFWNCDAPFPLVSLCGSVVYDDGTPAAGATVIVSTDGAGVAMGWTDGNGVFCGKFPKGYELTIEVWLPGCPDPVVVVTRGPYLSDGLTIQEIVIPLSATSVAGTVVCDGVPVMDATLLITGGFSTYVRSAGADGTFDIDLSQSICGDSTTYSIRAIAPDGSASDVVVLDPSNPGALTLDVCTDCPLAVTVSEEPSPCQFGLGDLVASVSGGSGDYTYSWDGVPGDSVKFYEVQGIYCVEVTDIVENCSVTQCYTVELDSLQAEFFIAANVTTNPDCQASNGTVELEIFNGVAPYTIIWYQGTFDVELPAYNDQLTATGLSGGIYSAKVFDANGCEAAIQIQVSAVGGLDLEILVQNDCFSAVLEADVMGGTPPYIYEWITPFGQVFTDEVITVDFSGTYLVVVTDANGCAGENIADVILFDQQPSFVAIDSCFEDGRFKPIYLDQMFFYNILDSQGNSLFAGNDFVYNHDLMTGEFLLTAEVSIQNCNDVITAELPNFEGLTILTSTGGLIEYEVDVMADCNQCQVGVDEILSEDYVDVTMQNGSLPSGVYYVVVRDDFTDCVVAVEEVVLP